MFCLLTGNLEAVRFQYRARTDIMRLEGRLLPWTLGHMWRPVLEDSPYEVNIHGVHMTDSAFRHLFPSHQDHIRKPFLACLQSSLLLRNNHNRNMVKMHVSKKQVINFHRVYPDQHQVFQDPAAAIELQHRTVDDNRTTGAAAQRVRQGRT